MKGIFNGLTKWIILLLALGAGFVFVLKTFLNPPKSSVPIALDTESSQPVLPSTEDSQVNNPVEAEELPESEKQSKPNNSEVDNNNQSPLSEGRSTGEPELVRNTQPEKNNNNIPTTKQPEEYVLEIPSKLEEGAELKVYLNNDESEKPNPANYSPSEIIKTRNIALALEEENNIFQESTGYFRIPKSGEYNFLIEHPNEPYFDDGRLLGKIDQEPLGNSRGGRVKLNEGWHRFDLFYNPQSYARLIDEQEITVKIGKPGEVAEKIEIWREAKDTAQKPETKQTK